MQGKGELAWDTWPICLVLKLSLQSENETNNPLKSGPALARPARPATPPLKQGRDDIIVKVNLQSLIPASFSH